MMKRCFKISVGRLVLLWFLLNLHNCTVFIEPFLDDAKEALASVGVPKYEYKPGELWLLCGQKRYGLQNPKEIEFKHGYDNVHLTVNMPQGSVKLLYIKSDK